MIARAFFPFAVGWAAKVIKNEAESVTDKFGYYVRDKQTANDEPTMGMAPWCDCLASPDSGASLLAHIDRLPDSRARRWTDVRHARRSRPCVCCRWHVYEIPAVKFWTRTLVSHVGVALLTCALVLGTAITQAHALSARPQPVQGALEILFAIWIAGFAVDWIEVRREHTTRARARALALAAKSHSPAHLPSPARRRVAPGA